MSPDRLLEREHLCDVVLQTPPGQPLGNVRNRSRLRLLRHHEDQLEAHRQVPVEKLVEGDLRLRLGLRGIGGYHAVDFRRAQGVGQIAAEFDLHHTVDAPSVRELEHPLHDRLLAVVDDVAGAGDVINYREEPVVERVLELTDGRGVDRVVEVEFGGNLTDALGATKIDGVIATYASQAEPEPQIPFYQLLYRNLTVRFELVFMMPEESKAAAVSDITKWLAGGRLQHNVAEVFPLEQAVGAHQAVEAGPVGKVILNVGPRA